MKTDQFDLVKFKALLDCPDDAYRYHYLVKAAKQAVVEIAECYTEIEWFEGELRKANKTIDDLRAELEEALNMSK